MLHTKCQDNQLTGSREEDFRKVSFYYIGSWRSSWSCDLNHLNKILIANPREAPHEICLQSAKWSQRRRCLKMSIDDRL